MCNLTHSCSEIMSLDACGIKNYACKSKRFHRWTIERLSKTRCYKAVGTHLEMMWITEYYNLKALSPYKRHAIPVKLFLLPGHTLQRVPHYSVFGKPGVEMKCNIISGTHVRSAQQVYGKSISRRWYRALDFHHSPRLESSIHYSQVGDWLK